MMRALLIAIQFLTRIPVPYEFEMEPADIGRSLLVYPVVGLIIGGVLTALVVVTASMPVELSALLVLLVWVLITGALHLDGLADSADAWLGGQGDRERSLEIMKDSRIGVMGAVVLVLLLLFKFVSLQLLMEDIDYLTLLVAPMLGRAAVVGLFLTTPNVRPGGLAEALVNHLPHSAAKIVLGVSLLIALLATGSFMLLLVVVVLGFVLRYLMIKRIGGTTGDTAGAMIEIIEAAVLLVLVSGS